MPSNFRQRARDALQRARTELASGSNERTTYAALELRMAIECVTYERAKAYEKEFPPREYDVWQPTKLMKELLELDPHADASATLSFGLEDEPGVPPKEMKTLGSESVFSMKDIKSSYDALGSFLHQPTLKQISNGGDHNWQKLHARCEELIVKLEAVLASPVFNLNFGVFTTFQCMNDDCGKSVRKRLPQGKSEVAAVCFECGAEHVITVDPKGLDMVRPVVQDVPCAKAGCKNKIQLFKHELKEGASWKCHECGTQCLIGLSVFEAPSPQSKN